MRSSEHVSEMQSGKYSSDGFCRMDQQMFFLFDIQKEQNLSAFNFIDVEWHAIQSSQQVPAKRKKNLQSLLVFKGYLNYIALEF